MESSSATPKVKTVFNSETTTLITENFVLFDELDALVCDVEFFEKIKAVGWENYFTSIGSKFQFEKLVREFWKNVQYRKGMLISNVSGFPVDVSEEIIADAIGCPREGLEFKSTQWYELFGGSEKVSSLMLSLT